MSGKGKTEGGIRWNRPLAFSPVSWPDGLIYARTHGDAGHEISSGDAIPEDRYKIRDIHDEAIRTLDSLPTPLGISKDPYMTVALPWVRAVIPELYIVGIVRRPVPNAFSLWKRFQPESGTSSPEEGWWGVKPAGWRELVSDDKVSQIAHQWDRVNRKMVEDQACLDELITYDDLCSSPGEVVKSILSKATGKSVVVDFDFDKLPSCDDEYRRGAQLLPRRREWAQSNDLVLPEIRNIEIEPFDEKQTATVESICSETAGLFNIDCK